MGNRDGKSGQYPTGNLGIEGTGNLGKGYGKSGHRNDLQALISKRMDHKVDYHSTVATPGGGHGPAEYVEISIEAGMPAGRRSKPRAASRRGKKWPDLSPFDLWNPVDLANAHELLVALGLAIDGYDGLRRTVLAAVLARRLADRNPHGYFTQILRDGFSRFGPADRDHGEAKATLRELFN